jgi:hypothetical protein
VATGAIVRRPFHKSLLADFEARQYTRPIVRQGDILSARHQRCPSPLGPPLRLPRRQIAWPYTAEKRKGTFGFGGQHGSTGRNFAGMEDTPAYDLDSHLSAWDNGSSLLGSEFQVLFFAVTN